jgi:hypothetical protein
VFEHEPLLSGHTGRRHTDADEQFFVVGIVEGVEDGAIREPHRRLIDDSVQLPRRSRDDLGRSVIAQQQRAAVNQRLHERAPRVRRRRASEEPRRQIADRTQPPRDRHVLEGHLEQSAKDRRRRGVDNDRDPIAKLCASGNGIESRGARNRQSRHRTTNYAQILPPRAP